MIFMNSDLQIIPVSSYEFEGFTYSRNIFELWTTEELAEIGVYEVRFDEIPEGKYATDWVYSFEGSWVRAKPVLEDIKDLVPSVVSKAQGKAALVLKGKFEGVVGYIDSLPEPDHTLAQIAFNDTNDWRRDSPFLNNAANHLGLSDEDLDELFKTANGINL